jgi:hypothetical protein
MHPLCYGQLVAPEGNIQLSRSTLFVPKSPRGNHVPDCRSQILGSECDWKLHLVDFGGTGLRNSWTRSAEGGCGMSTDLGDRGDLVVVDLLHGGCVSVDQVMRAGRQRRGKLEMGWGVGERRLQHAEGRPPVGAVVPHRMERLRSRGARWWGRGRGGGREGSS